MDLSPFQWAQLEPSVTSLHRQSVLLVLPPRKQHGGRNGSEILGFSWSDQVKEDDVQGM
jgi:hypothetical protein